jgi:hypothetical protein
MINLIDWADYLTVAVFAKAATYLTEAEGISIPWESR